MTRDEFIDICVQCGYCNRKAAVMYSKEKENLTDNDLIEVYRINERALDLSRDTGKYQMVEGVKTTKRYKQTERMGSDRNE